MNTTYNNTRNNIHYGDILYIDLPVTGGSVQSGNRPCLIVSNDRNNEYSNTVNVIPITSRKKKRLPCHVEMKCNSSGLNRDSVLLVEQMTTVDKSRITGYVGKIKDAEIFSRVAAAMKVQFTVLTVS